MDSQREFFERIHGALEVLRASLSDLRYGSEGAEGSLRRVSRSIGRTAADMGFEEIRRQALGVEKAEDRSRLVSGVRALTTSIENLQKESPPTPTSILLVDDDPASATLLQAVLQEPNREILTATTAAEARDTIRVRELDLLILDLMLPDVDGRDFLLELREDPALAGMPLVVFSGLSANQAKAECLALGADDYLEKPVDAELARSVVAARLRAGRETGSGIQTDTAGGFPDRAALGQAFEALKQECPGPDKPLSLARIRISGLEKGARRQHPDGHQKLLEVFAEGVAGTLEEDDLLTVDPDGLVNILFSGKAPQEAAVLLRRVQEETVGSQARASKEPGQSMDFSAGVVELSREEVLKKGISRADWILFRASALGADQVLAEGEDTDITMHRIMLVEDDPLTATLIVHRLGRDDFEVVHFSDGKTAFEAVQEEAPFSLAIFDVKLPGMDGFELLQRVKGLPHFSRIPIMMLTAMGRESDIVRAFGLGAKDYVLKPFSPPELVARIRRTLGEQV